MTGETQRAGDDVRPAAANHRWLAKTETGKARRLPLRMAAVYQPEARGMPFPRLASECPGGLTYPGSLGSLLLSSGSGMPAPGLSHQRSLSRGVSGSICVAVSRAVATPFGWPPHSRREIAHYRIQPDSLRACRISRIARRRSYICSDRVLRWFACAESTTNDERRA